MKTAASSGPLRLQPGDDLRSREAGHDDVAEDGVDRRVALGELERLRAVAGDDDGVAGAREHAPRHFTDGVVVLDQEDRLGAGAGRLGVGAAGCGDACFLPW